MFTGIVKATASVVSLEKLNSSLRYAIEFPKEMLDGLEKGASVSVDGVCQTVVEIEQQKVWFEAIPTTLNCTTLAQICQGYPVNLERSAKIGDEIGGHLLSGHIYGTATIASIQENIYTFQCPNSWMKYLFLKGFVAIDGISLTLQQVNKSTAQFSVHLIPETLKRTTLGQKQVNSLVNIEFDALTLSAVETIENLLYSL